jgi:hypothetical protein
VYVTAYLPYGAVRIFVKIFLKLSLKVLTGNRLEPCSVGRLLKGVRHGYELHPSPKLILRLEFDLLLESYVPGSQSLPNIISCQTMRPS